MKEKRRTHERGKETLRNNEKDRKKMETEGKYWKCFMGGQPWDDVLNALNSP